MLGATGTIGRLVADRAEEAGHEVRRVSRSAGIDVATPPGLARAVADVDVVVDALNLMTLSRRKAVAFFSGTARSVSAAAATAGVQRTVCVSIAGAADPAVQRFYGYYAGKAAQEDAYRAGPVPVTLVHSTQWFELVPVIARQVTLGPVSVLPTMRMAPVAADRVARLVVAECGSPAEGEWTVAIRGPEVMTVRDAMRTWLRAVGAVEGMHPRVMAELPYFGRAMATDGLIPRDAATDELTLREWLAAR